MAGMNIRNAQALDISQLAPPTAVAIKIALFITPESGAALVYSAKATAPIRFDGPTDTKEVPIDGPTIHIELIQGATRFEAQCLGWTDSN